MFYQPRHLRAHQRPRAPLNDSTFVARIDDAIDQRCEPRQGVGPFVAGKERRTKSRRDNSRDEAACRLLPLLLPEQSAPTKVSASALHLVNLLGFSGGRTRARTWDPLIKSQ